MALHDPLLAKQCGGQETYERLVAEGAFYRPDAISNMRPIDQLRYARNTAIASAGLVAGVVLEAYGFFFTETPTRMDFGPVVVGAFPLAFATSLLAESNARIRDRYRNMSSSL